MMKKILIITLLTLTLIGCSLSGRTITQAVQQEQFSSTSLPTLEPTSIEVGDPFDSIRINEPIPAVIMLMTELEGEYSLENSKDSKTKCATVNVKNFKAEVTFTDLPFYNSYQNSFGMIDRSNSVIAIGRGEWYALDYADGEIVSEDSGDNDMEFAEGDRNHLEVFGIDETGYVYLNGEYLFTFDLSNQMHTGDICVLTGFYSDDKDGIISTFEDFKVWALEPL